MDWLTTLLFGPPSVAGAILIYSLVIALGRAVGAVRIGSFELGSAGVMFIGLALGHFGFRVEPTVVEFARDFGLILFVFAIGLSIGPGFLNALRSQGLRLNALALLLVLSSTLMVYAASRWAGVAMPVAVGIFSGATTNTPSLAVASSLLRDDPPTTEQVLAALRQASPKRAREWEEKGTLSAEDDALLRTEAARMPSLGYAVCYPGGILGTLLAIWFLRVYFRVDPEAEAEQIRKEREGQILPVTEMTLKVTNPNLNGITIGEIPSLKSMAVTVSRHRRGESVEVAQPSTKIALGDHLLVVGEVPRLEEFRMIVGEKEKISFDSPNREVQARRLLVSVKHVVGHTVEELHFSSRFGVQVTRIVRSGIELPAAGGSPLQLGDELMVVGTLPSIQQVAHFVGDTPRNLWQPDLVPIFVGVALGVLLGSIPFTLPIIGVTIKLGLAGGVLMVALVVSNWHRIGPLVWFLKPSASFLMREMGIALFLASVGLRSGDRFVETLLEGDGFRWMGMGALVTFLPLLIVSYVGFRWLSIPYLSMAGLLAGAMTAPAALSFANQQAHSDRQSVAYASVFPLTMMGRIVCAQALIVAYLHG